MKTQAPRLRLRGAVERFVAHSLARWDTAAERAREHCRALLRRRARQEAA